MKKESTLYEAILQTASLYPKRDALIYLNKKISHEELLLKIQKLSAGLLAYGIKKDDVVTVCLPNIPHAIYLLYALNQIGAIANLIHPLIKLTQMKNILKQTKSKYLFMLDISYLEFLSLKEEGIHLFSCSPTDFMSVFVRAFYYLKNASLLKKIKKEDQVISLYEYEVNLVYDQDYRKDALYLHSGGTGGEPKVIALSSYSVNALSSNGLDILGIKEIKNKYMLAVLPLFHGFGLCMGVHACLSLGMANTLMPKFNADQVIKYIKKEQLSFIIGVPVLFENLLKNKKFAGYHLKNLKIAFVGGDFSHATLFDRFNEVMIKYGSSCRLYEGYGLTEVVTVCSVNNKTHYKKGTVGKMLANTKMKVMSLDGKENLGFNQDGELYVSGETLMNGYRFLKEGEKQPFVKDKDGTIWVPTGDFGSLDQDNFVYFKQRLKRIIKVSGVNIFPNEIEVLVSSLKEVYECAVVPKDDEKLGQVLKLFIVLDHNYENIKLDEKVKELILNNASIYAVPKEIVYLKQLPKTLVGKIDTIALEKMN